MNLAEHLDGRRHKKNVKKFRELFLSSVRLSIPTFLVHVSAVMRFVSGHQGSGALCFRRSGQHF